MDLIAKPARGWHGQAAPCKLPALVARRLEIDQGLYWINRFYPTAARSVPIAGQPAGSRRRVLLAQCRDRLSTAAIVIARGERRGERDSEMV